MTSYRSHRVPSRAVVAFILVGMFLLVPSVVRGSGAFEPIGETRFFQVDTVPLLADPGLIKTGPDGTLAVWDQKLQQYFFHEPGDTETSGTAPERPDGESLNSLFKDVHQGNVLKGWSLANETRGFFDGKGTFWYYDQDLSRRADTFSIHSFSKPLKKLVLPGPIQSIVPSENQLIVQYANRKQSLVRWDPYSPDAPVDTATFNLKGRLLDFTSEGLYLTRTEDTLRSYDSGRNLNTRTFSSITDVEVVGSSIYVLSGAGEIVRLDSTLTAQFTFFLPRGETYRSIAVQGDTLYVTAKSGLYRGVLDESERSFFSQSSDVYLTSLAKSLPTFDEPAVTPKLWLDAGPASVDLLVQNEDDLVKSLQFRNGNFSEPVTQGTGGLDTNQFQFFKVDSTYWDGRNNLYYYFPSERAVEQYDTGGELVKRRKFNFKAVETLRDVKFVGATRRNVMFSGEVLDSDEGYRRNLIIYSWSGKVQRVVDPVHPFGSGDYSTLESPEWEFSGHGNLYELHTNYIQLYDLQGFPRETINEVYKPVDVFRGEEALFVLDLNGQRLRAFSVPELPSNRFGAPPGVLSVHDATAHGPTTILTARSSGKPRLSLYEYNSDSMEYQQVLAHPSQSLHYPTLSDNGDTVYFFGKRPENSRWTLYRSDTVKYSARPLETIQNVRGKGFYETNRGLFFVPVQSRADTGPRYRYLDPAGDTQSLLENSHELDVLTPGGFAGFFGVMEKGDADVIVSGYLSRRTETAPLRWTVADTLYRSSRPVEEILVENDRIYIIQGMTEGHSRLGRLSTGYSSDFNRGETEKVTWLADFRGNVSWLNRSGNHYDLVLRTRPEGGKLLKWYPERSPSPGGLQGRLTIPSPSDLEGIPLRVNPGGISSETQKTGRFSFSGVPSGYVELNIPSYRHHFAYPVHLPVRSGEYSVRSSLPLAQEEELLLLEGGLKYLQQERIPRAKISLNAFRELVQTGPYYDWTDGLIEKIYRLEADTDAMFQLFDDRPELFDARERMSLLRENSDLNRRLSVYRSYRGFLETNLSDFLEYQTGVLTRRVSGGTLNAADLKVPLLEENSRRKDLPVFGSK